jgi:hypothetical protein
MKMVTVRIPASDGALWTRIQPKLKDRYQAYSWTSSGECGIRERGHYAIIYSTEHPGGKRAKAWSYGELLVTLPAHVVRKGVKTEAVGDCFPQERNFLNLDGEN